MIHKYKGIEPKIGKNCFIDNSAQVIGDITMGDECSIWFNAVIRGDVNKVTIGDRTNIQDGAVLHVSSPIEGKPKEVGALKIANDVTVGHGVILHGCTIEQFALVGMGAVVLDRANIGEYALVAAGSVVKEGFEVPPYTLVAGNPAKIKKEFPKTEETRKHFINSAKNYVNLKEDFR